jgi:hypothetical protein
MPTFPRFAAVPISVSLCTVAVAQGLAVADAPPTGSLVYDERHQRAVAFDPPRRWEWRVDRWQLDPAPMPAPPPGAGRLSHYDGHRGVWFGLSDAMQFVAWNGAAWSTTTPAVAPPPREAFGLAFDRDRRRVVLFGGNNPVWVMYGTGGAWVQYPRNDTWEWDGVGWHAMQPAASPSLRYGMPMVHDPVRRRTVLFGGDHRADTWVWDGSAWTQVVTPTSPVDQANVGTFDVGLGKVVVAAGGHLLWAFDGADWSVVTGPPHAVPDARLVATGGVDLLMVGSRTTRHRRLGGWGEHPFPAVGTLVHDAARGVLLAYDGTELLAWSGTWARTAGAPPPTRSYTAATFDDARAELVVFGGSPLPLPIAAFDDTWLWNGRAWRQATPAVRPPARMWHAMAYDAVRQVVVLFGGRAATPTFLQDTWLWNGSTWQLAATPLAPPARGQHGLACDAARGRIVLTGGGLGLASAFADTWEWDGATWQAKPAGDYPGTAPLVLASRIVYDGLLQKVVSFPASGPIAWDGTSWQPLAVGAPGAAALAGDALAHDAATARLFALGANGLRTFGPTPASVVAYGAGCGAVPPVLQTSGRAAPGNLTFELAVATHRAGTATFLLLGFGPAQTPLGGGCTALVSGPSVLVANAAAGGFADFALPIPNELALRGLAVHAQAVTAVAGGAFAGFDLSAAVRVLLGD